MSNYTKYYNINKNRANTNKCLLKLPCNISNSRYGWNTKFVDVLTNYFTQIWFSEKGKSENILFKYVQSVIAHEKFDFEGYQNVGDTYLYQNPFAELPAEHDTCTVNIYSERVYTNFNSIVLDYHGTHVSLLVTLLHHPELVNGLNYIGYDEEKTSYRRYHNLSPKEIEKLSEFSQYLLNRETATKEEIKLIVDGFNHFVNHVSKQKMYSADELRLSYRDTSFTSNIFSLYLEFFIYIKDTDRINQLFEIFHKVGNTKAKNFNMYLKKTNGETFTERPISKHLTASVINSTKCSLDELYYFINFYANYDGGKFLSKILSDSLIQSFIMAFKVSAALKLPVGKEYYTLFNKIKDEEVYTLETFEQMNMLIANKLDGSKALDVLEQNFAMLELCLNSDVYTGRWSSEVYNIFTHIDYDGLNDSQKNRYWKMVANFVNNTKFKAARIKKILNDITKLLNITTGDLITKLQPEVISIKQPILLEMYLE